MFLANDAEQAGHVAAPLSRAAQFHHIVAAKTDEYEIKLFIGHQWKELVDRPPGSYAVLPDDMPSHRFPESSGQLLGESAREALFMCSRAKSGNGRFAYHKQLHRRLAFARDSGLLAGSLRQ